MRPPIRLAALMGLHVVHVFTHDSIALGEDTYPPTGGATGRAARHSRSDPDPPGDANETAVAWRVALETRDCPVAFRADPAGAVPTLDRGRYAPADGLRRGAYVLLGSARRQTRR